MQLKINRGKIFLTPINKRKWKTLETISKLRVAETNDIYEIADAQLRENKFNAEEIIETISSEKLHKITPVSYALPL